MTRKLSAVPARTAERDDHQIIETLERLKTEQQSMRTGLAEMRRQLRRLQHRPVTIPTARKPVSRIHATVPPVAVRAVG
jgi:hypothetical protein